MTVPTRYRTIVADPPWPYRRSFNGFSSGKESLQGGRNAEGLSPFPYRDMTVEEIATLPVTDLADDAAHLYLWTTQKFLWDAPEVVRAWGFSPSVLLTWCKEPMGRGLGDAFTPTTEFVLFAHRGRLRPVARHESTWFAGKRGKHSVKPEAFLDLVEQVSPGPYVELFARRDRLGWDTWGDQSLGTAGCMTDRLSTTCPACEFCENGVGRDGDACIDCEGTGCSRYPFCDIDHDAEEAPLHA